MPCSLSVLLSIQRSPLSDSLLVAYLCSPISFLFNLSASLRSSRGHFHYGMFCAFPPSVCICVIYNADQEGGMWKIIREARAVPRLGASSPGQSKQLLGGQWATGMGGQLWPCCGSPASFSWSTASASQAGCISCQHPTGSWRRFGMRDRVMVMGKDLLQQTEKSGWPLGFPALSPPLSCLWKEKLFSYGSVPCLWGSNCFIWLIPTRKALRQFSRARLRIKGCLREVQARGNHVPSPMCLYGMGCPFNGSPIHQ